MQIYEKFKVKKSKLRKYLSKMTESIENQIEKMLTLLRESPLTAYKISQKTGISQAAIHNYRNGKTKPNLANTKLLLQFLTDENSHNTKKNSENTINGNNNIVGDNSKIDNRQYYSDSPDVLRAQIEVLDERIKEKDAQIKEKDAQINRLLGILEGYNKK